MRLCTIRLDGTETAAVATANGIVPITSINAHLGRAWPTDVLSLVEAGLSTVLLRDAERTPHALPAAAVRYGPLYRRPRKIWGIGLNYRDHAADLAAPFPTEPASFMKGDHTIIGHGDAIELPPESERVTAEAELGVIIGRRCRDVSEDDVAAVIAGYCLIIDMTAEDILQRNPRFLTRAKNFDTFFSFGPELITQEEVLDVMRLNVGTWCNGALHRQNVVCKHGISAGVSRCVPFTGHDPLPRRYHQHRHPGGSSNPARRYRGVPHRGVGQLEQSGAPPQQRGLLDAGLRRRVTALDRHTAVQSHSNRRHPFP